jgi:hypothetical protein
MSQVEMFWTVIGALVVYDLIKFGLTVTWLTMTDKESEEPQEQFEFKPILLDIEVDGNILRCYKKENSQFICQGKDLEELATGFHERFPNEVGMVPNYNGSGEDLLFIQE